MALAAVTSNPGEHRERALVQTWSKQLESARVDGKGKDTPVTRVTNLLKELTADLKKEMEEDEKLHKELMCWCNDQKWKKSEELAATNDRIKFLISEIERLTALVAELESEIAALTKQLEELKAELLSAAKIHDDKVIEYKKTEDSNIAAKENLRAAIIVLSKHHQDKGNLPKTKTERDSWALLQETRSSSHVKGNDIWGGGHENANSRAFDEFMLTSGVDEDTFQREAKAKHGAKFLQQEDAPKTPKAEPAADRSWLKRAEAEASRTTEPTLSYADQATVQTALASARAIGLLQGGQQYTPEYSSQSGEILGILKQMYEETEVTIGTMMKTEKARVSNFIEMRKEKIKQIAACAERLDMKEDQLAQAKIDLANAKEELAQLEKVSAYLVKYLAVLKKTCEEAEKNFGLRKAARLEEIKAVSDTIGILQDDDARDAFAGTYGETMLLQVSSESSLKKQERKQASDLLRRAAKKTGSVELSVLATKVMAGVFDKVIKAIDELVEKLHTQQEDEQKQFNWCGDKIQETDMETMKKEDVQKDLETKIEGLKLKLKSLAKEIEEHKAEIAESESGLQAANIERQETNLDFQKTVADQRATIEVFSKALDKLATYYDGKGDSYTVALQQWRKAAGFVQEPASFVQRSASRHQQPTSSSSSSSTSVSVTVGQSDGFSKVDTTAVAARKDGYEAEGPDMDIKLGAPVAIASFKPSSGGGGVMQMIEKLIYDAKTLMKEAIAGEVEAQAGYESYVTETNDTIASLQKSIVEKTKEIAESKKLLGEAESDLIDITAELEDLSKYSKSLHSECDFYIKNFATRQAARAAELESLSQAKGVLVGSKLT